MIQAAAERAFDFSKGSPLSDEYNIRLGLILAQINKRNIEDVYKMRALYDMFICLQRTLTNSDDLLGDAAFESYRAYGELKLMYMNPKTSETKTLTNEEKISHYKNLYRTMIANE